jgi:hypothetical protein
MQWDKTGSEHAPRRPRKPNAPCRAGGPRIFDDEGGLAACTLWGLPFSIGDDAGCGDTPLVPGKPRKKKKMQKLGERQDEPPSSYPIASQDRRIDCHGGPQQMPIL